MRALISRLRDGGVEWFDDRRQRRHVRFVNTGTLIATAAALVCAGHSWAIGARPTVTANLLAADASLPAL